MNPAAIALAPQGAPAPSTSRATAQSGRENAFADLMESGPKPARTPPPSPPAPPVPPQPADGVAPGTSAPLASDDAAGDALGVPRDRREPRDARAPTPQAPQSTVFSASTPFAQVLADLRPQEAAAPQTPLAPSPASLSPSPAKAVASAATGPAGPAEAAERPVAAAASPIVGVSLETFLPVAATSAPALDAAGAPTAASGTPAPAAPDPAPAAPRPVRTLVVDLAPEDVGAVRVRLRLAEGGLQVQVAAQTRDAREALDADRAGLIRRLDDAGYRVDRLDVAPLAAPRDAGAPDARGEPSGHKTGRDSAHPDPRDPDSGRQDSSRHDSNRQDSRHAQHFADRDGRPRRRFRVL